MKIAIGLCLIFLSACVSQSAVLVNPQGKSIVCRNSGWGWIGAPVAMSNQSECIKKAKAAGYMDVAAVSPEQPETKPTKPAHERPF